jgi:hypothetical protein
VERAHKFRELAEEFVVSLRDAMEAEQIARTSREGYPWRSRDEANDRLDDLASTMERVFRKMGLKPDAE